MKKIKELVKHIKSELDDAEEYAENSLMYRDEDPALAEMYMQLAKDELRHKDIEHEHIVRLIKDYRNAGNEPPETMMAIWDWQHQQIIERQAAIRAMMSLYK